jgi:imidazole glycerol-phosphate synthase subunit HisH
MIVIIDYGVGNVHSILNMFKKIGVDAKLSENPEELLSADKVILPGVGSFDYGMKQLKDTGYYDYVLKYVNEVKKPLLGICLGMQMLGISSEEGVEPGLGLIPFKNVKFKFEDSKLKVPHMGWNIVKSTKPNEKFSENFTDDFRFYFVHSYYAVCENDDNILLTCDYSSVFSAAVQKDNIYGVQFHPEKSHKFGMLLLKNFSELV